ncbi:MAG TPA: VOC family protein [Thermoanaerobaculia bacterium]|nr:VOC family protein [Thermoanaerobaculia bacterium]
MKLEHVALLVADPPAMARWYEENLAMRVVKQSDEAPGFARFLADEAGASILETYASEVHPVPDYRAKDPALLHVAFATGEIAGTRDRLIAAGATPAGEITENAAGDRFAMLRDPWGLALQLAQRVRPLAG